MKRFALTLILLCAMVSGGVSCSDEDSPEKVYRVGDFYASGQVKGVVFAVEDQGRHGLIVSLDETEAQWAIEAAAAIRTGADDDQEGEDNMEAIRLIADWQTKFPAFAWCATLNPGADTGWFLPAFEELAMLYNSYAANVEAFNKMLTDHGGTALALPSSEDGKYWSSSENLIMGKESEAAYFYLSDAAIGFGDKAAVARVRAIRKF